MGVISLRNSVTSVLDAPAVTRRMALISCRIGRFGGKKPWMREPRLVVALAVAFATVAEGCAGEHHARSPASENSVRHPEISGSGYDSGSSPPPREEAALTATYGGKKPLARQSGQASYYGNSLAGHRTASGERYDPRAFTAAHRTLPLGTTVRVTRVDTGQSVVVRITDRGPFGSAHRIIDLSHAAAERLHMIRQGVAEVHLDVLEYGPSHRR
jgi:rare lipoprotein A